jgi:topoisomerase-4 subunit A
MARKDKNVIEIKENIETNSLDEIMGEKYADYARDVIQDRAIPDARDGLKPVQRRILFDMYNTGNTIDKPTKKCAHIVGDVMGKYHPHGDSSIYLALVHMSQPWAYRYPLIDFQGNNGSIDGDGPAAYRYTEARLSALSEEMLRDIDEDTVKMNLTFDDTLQEPDVLPSRFPNLLVNGSEGIAVGIATSIPPHNLKEVTQAICYRIKHPNCAIDDLIRYIPGPDFPTGGIIYESESLKDIYRTGHGRVVVSSRCEITKNEDGIQQIIVHEIPYQVNKSELVKSIDKIRHDKTIPGIDEVRDESDKDGLRIAIDLKDDCKPEAILAYLMAKTQLQTGYTANMMAIVDGHPKSMDLITYCDCYIQHQLDVITRRSNFRHAKDAARLSIVNGLLKAQSILDKVVAVIKSSQDKADSKVNLEKAFGFTEDQAEAIVMMPLYKLSHTDVTVLEQEKASLEADLKLLDSLLKDQGLREDLIINDLQTIAKTYAGKRLTEIRPEEEAQAAVSVDKRDLIANEDVYVVATRDGYLKRSSLKSWKGSGGQNGNKPGIKAGDAFVYNGLCNTRDFMLIFTNRGNYLYIPVDEIKETKWNEEGFHVNQLVALAPEEKLVRGFAVRHFRDDLYLVVLSKKGYIKRIALSSFPVVRRSKPIPALKLINDDELVDAALTTGNSNLYVASIDGKAAFYNENEIAVTNPKTGGMKAGNFKGSLLAGVLAFAPEEKDKILMITNRGATRVFDLSHIDVTARLGKTTLVFQMFQKEPHELVYLGKLGNKNAPFAFDGVLSDASRVDVVFPDFYLTPMEKYVKRPDGFSVKERILYVSVEDSPLIDDSIVSYAPPVAPAPEVAATEQNPDDKAFEQISLFDEEGGDEKK